MFLIDLRQLTGTGLTDVALRRFAVPRAAPAGPAMPKALNVPQMD